ncbi:MAG: hypothetical protein H0W86_11865 [Armatimonadetes bacterium]|nr:hypothetical protein [Armatimonadota bacterium]
MKRNSVLLATGLLLCGASSAFSATIRDIIRQERLSPQEAAAVVAISKGVGVSTNEVLKARKDLREKAWDLAPAFFIAERTRQSPRTIWQEHERGASWQSLERDRNTDYGRRKKEKRDRYDDGYRYDDGDHRYDDDNDRYDDRNRGQGGGLEDVLGDVLGRRRNDRYDDQYDYRNDRNYADRDYERRVWDQILERAYKVDANRLWRWVEQGMNEGDLSLAAHVGKLARVDPNEVLYELERNRKSWNRVREIYGISSDWERRERRPRNNRDRNDWDFLGDIFRIN